MTPIIRRETANKEFAKWSGADIQPLEDNLDARFVQEYGRLHAREEFFAAQSRTEGGRFMDRQISTDLAAFLS